MIDEKTIIDATQKLAKLSVSSFYGKMVEDKDMNNRYIANAVLALKEAYLQGYADGIEKFYEKFEEEFWKGVERND